MAKLLSIWGGLTHLGENRWGLAAPRGTADGIGAGLAALDLGGKKWRVKVERVDWWRPEPWAHLWWAGSIGPEVHPMPFLRFTEVGMEGGVCLTGDPEDEIITCTMGAVGPVQTDYIVSQDADGLHVFPIGERWNGRTWDIPGRGAAYVEGCVAELTFREAGNG